MSLLHDLNKNFVWAIVCLKITRLPVLEIWQCKRSTDKLWRGFRSSFFYVSWFNPKQKLLTTKFLTLLNKTFSAEIVWTGVFWQEVDVWKHFLAHPCLWVRSVSCLCNAIMAAWPFRQVGSLLVSPADPGHARFEKTWFTWIKVGWIKSSKHTYTRREKRMRVVAVRSAQEGVIVDRKYLGMAWRRLLCWAKCTTGRDSGSWCTAPGKNHYTGLARVHKQFSPQLNAKKGRGRWRSFPSILM